MLIVVSEMKNFNTEACKYKDEPNRKIF